MLQKMLNNKVRVIQLIFLVVLLAIVRAFENTLFYDPLLHFFKKDFNNLPLPNTNPFQLFLGVLFRYGLNSILSLGVIYVLFEELAMIKFAAILYGFFFIILILAFFFIIYFTSENHNWALFYVRRFLIQPIFVILFVPGFLLLKSK